MAVRNATIRGRGLAAQNGLTGQPYRYRGIPGWNPATLPPLAVAGSQRLRHEEAAQRRQKFAALRAQGVPVIEAGTAVGIAAETAKKYEMRRRKAARAVAERGEAC